MQGLRTWRTRSTGGADSGKVEGSRAVPTGLTADELRAKGSQFEDAAMLVSLTLESVGIMIHRRIVSIDMVWELMGGVILETWDRIELWVRDIRRTHVRYADWKA
jgi:hypothetical protein